MTVKADTEKHQLLESLLGEARAEADSLCKRLKRMERVVTSTRLIMGHELKRPTTAITGYLELAEDELADDDRDKALSHVRRARNECSFLNDLNEFFLELLKVDSSSESLESSQIELESFLPELLDHIPDDLEPRKRVRLELEPELGVVDFNPRALRLILLNLIENALAYSDDSSVVRVEAQRVQDKRGMVSRELLKIRVVDKGAGIPPNFLRKVFSPFVRLHEDVAGGSGLGLTLVKSLVELNGGEVFVHSKSGKGTTFHLTIPIDEDGDIGETNGPIIS